MARKRITLSKNVTTNQVRDEFLLQKKAEGCSPATVANYNITLQRFYSLCELDNKPVGVITPETINHFTQSLLGALQPASVNHYLREIRALINYLDSHGYVEGFEIKQIKCQKQVKEWYEDEEVVKLLSFKPYDFVSDRTKSAIVFMLSTGARASTVVNVKIQDCNLTYGTCSYSHTKNKQPLVAPLSSNTVKIIQQYYNKWLLGNEYSEYLFISQYGEQLTVNGLYQAVKNYCGEAGVEFKGLHAIRRTFARYFIIQGGNPLKLQQILGHSTLAMTKQYVQLFGTDLKQGFDELNPVDNLLPKQKKKIG